MTLGDLILGLGFVCLVEGLVLALIPSRLEEMLAYFRTLSPDALRVAGLTAAICGVVLIAVSKV